MWGFVAQHPPGRWVWPNWVSQSLHLLAMSAATLNHDTIRLNRRKALLHLFRNDQAQL